MITNSQKEFFLVRDDDTGDTKLFHHWESVVNFLTDDIMKYGYNIIFQEDKENNFTWFTNYREPKDREECFNILNNMETLAELNDLLEDLWYIELIEFSD